MKENKTKESIKIPVRQRTNSFCDPLKFRVVSDETINLTRTRAFDFLESETFIGERIVRERHVQHLYDEWVAGRFMWNHVILSLAVFNGKHYRMNGQHTCWMRVNIPESQEPKSCDVRLIVYKVDTEDDLRNLYTTFDRNAPRTSSHVGKVLLVGSDCLSGVPISYTGNLLAAFRIFWAGELGTRRHRDLPVDEIVGLVEKNYCQLFNIVGRFLQIHYSEANWVRRAGVLGAMFATFEKNVGESDIFWSAVISGLNLTEKTDPRWQLRNWIQHHSLSTSMRGDAIKTSTEETFRICINAWNKYRSGETVAVMRPTETRVKAKA